MRSLFVAIAACTYRRPAGLQALLDGLAQLTFDGFRQNNNMPLRISVVIVDNEGNEEVRRICANFPAAQEWPLIYVHESQRGISFARNAALDHLPAGCDFVAMLDDDEVPAPDWLDQLLLAQVVTGADIVQGKVTPVFPEGTPEWIASGGFFGRPRRPYSLDWPRIVNVEERTCAGAGNVLVRVTAIEELGLRFDPALALSGGEDTMFFRILAQHGYRIIYSEQAVVYETIPVGRATLRYMVSERFRIGNSDTFIGRRLGLEYVRGGRALSKAVTHLGLGVRRVLKTSVGSKREKARFAIGVCEAAYGLGMITAALGYRHQHYR